MSKNSYHFAVYHHKLVIGTDRLINRNFIVLKDSYGDIACFTKLHKHIHSKRKNGAKSISDDGNNRFVFVSQFLNYVLINNYEKYRIDRICDLTFAAVQDFFHAYGTLDENGHGRSKITVDKCADAVMDFLISYIKANSWNCNLRLSDIVEESSSFTRRGLKRLQYIPKFEITYSGRSREILRDIPDSVFQLVLSYAASYHKEILMLIALSAFAGMRPSEACNVRQEISPLGSGIIIAKSNNRVRSISIDLREEKVLRSDLVSVGSIKKERIQKVYPKFITIFMQCYEIYKEYLTNMRFEASYCPLSITQSGKAMTYATYRQHFQKMIKEMIPLMLNHVNEEVQEYGHLLMEYQISPHIFRHWFSVRLTMFGEDAATLMYWRGDKSPESALTYLQNKSELSKRFKEVSDDSFASMLAFVNQKEGIADD